MKSHEQLAVDQIEPERNSRHILDDSSVEEAENLEYQYYYQPAKDKSHPLIYIACIILILVAFTFCYFAIQAVEYRQELFEVLKFFVLTGIGFLAGSRYSSRSE